MYAIPSGNVLLEKWSSATSCDQLKAMVSREEISPISTGVHDEISGSDTVDWVAMNFFPDDGQRNVLPASIYSRWKLFS